MLFWKPIFAIIQGIKKSLKAFIETENQKFRDEYAEKLLEKFRRNEIDIEDIISQTERHYKEELIQFADRVGPSDEDIFAQSFHRWEKWVK